MDANTSDLCGEQKSQLGHMVNALMIGSEVVPNSEVLGNFEDVWEEEQAKANANWEGLEEAWTQNQPVSYFPQKSVTIDEFCELWQNMWPMEEYNEGNYAFEDMNPYINDPDLSSTAQICMAKGDINASILALEAIVINNPEASDAWLLLGKLNAENDEDTRAISALKKSFSIDSYNSETLLALGISLINAKQEAESTEILMKWIHQNPLYMHLTSNNSSAFERTVDLYTQGSNLHPEDPALFQVLGSLYFTSKDYDLAISAFSNAVDKDKTNYYCWNRLGAALAHQGDNLNAIQAYQKALELRPAYVRAWANMGIAHANINEIISAIRFYLCALSYNPKASHIWNYLFTGFTCLSKI